MKNFFACFVVFALAGCAKAPSETASTNNTEFKVDTLFKKDGCTVYRFYDIGAYRYFVRCENGQTQTEL